MLLAKSSPPAWNVARIVASIALSGAAAPLLAQAAWQQMPWPTARGYTSATYDPITRTVLIAGGWNNYNLGDTWQWDGTGRTWTSLVVDGPPSPRHGNRTVFDAAHNQLLLFGGWDGGYTNSTWLWHRPSRSWQQVGLQTSPPARYQHGLAYDARRGRVVLFGGQNGGNLGDLWEWDGNTWSQPTIGGARPSARHGMAMTYDAASQAIILFGGYDGSPRNDTWRWDGSAWQLLAPPTPPSPRWATAMAYDAARGESVLFGGWSGTASLADTWRWNGTAGTWTLATPVTSPSARHQHTMTFDAARARVVVFAGFRNSTVPYGEKSDLWEWDGTDWQLAHAAAPPSRLASAACFHADATASNRGTLLFGGRAFAPSILSHLNDTWTWNGRAWVERSPATSPPLRSYSALAFHQPSGQSILFGGLTGPSTNLGDTWTWDGTGWTQRSPTSNPPARHDHAMTFDATRSQVLLFGGYATSAPVNDLWAWDGINWTPLLANGAPGSPSARYAHQIAHDPRNGRVILFGGHTTGGVGDTWQLTGTSWTQLNPTTNPGTRYYHSMQYDASRDAIVVFGGYNGSYLNDTWELRGSQWVQCSQILPPPTRSSAPIVYDPDHERLVMFGGHLRGGDTWECVNPNPATLTPILNSSCPAGTPMTLALTGNDRNNLPWVGGTLSLTLSNLPPATFLSTIAFGLQRSPSPLPWPGCSLNLDVLASVLLFGPGPLTATVGVPWSASWIGTQFAAQGVTLPAPNLTMTTALVARVGARH